MKYLEELNQQNAMAFEKQEVNDYKKEKNETFTSKYSGKILIIYLQLFSCLMILVSIFALKQLNPSTFINIKNFYNEKINCPVFQNFDFKSSIENVKKKLFGKIHRKFNLKNENNEILKENNSLLLTVPVSKPLNEGTVTSKFGIRKDPFTLQNKLHSGLDIGANNGEIIHAILPGTVIKAEKCGSYGNCVKLDHGNNIESLYAHCNKILVSEGDVIKRGQDLALVGNTGRATGNHLHLEILVNGIKQNPEIFLQNAYV